MNVNELQKLYNDVMKAIKENGCYLKDGKVIENKEVFVVTANGTFYDDYMGDSDWTYREAGGDIVISDEQGKMLIENIIPWEDVDESNEDKIVEASNFLGEILCKYTDDFERLYCIECGEFNDLVKENNSVQFHDEDEHEWKFDIKIHKKSLNEVKNFDVSFPLFGCI